MGAADVLLHGAISLFLCSMLRQSSSAGRRCPRGSDVGGRLDVDSGRLTPVQRLRQAEPSWLRSGQTTTLFSSETEKDPVSEARGGIASCIYPRARPSECGRVAAGAGAGRRRVGVNGGRAAVGEARRAAKSCEELRDSFSELWQAWELVCVAGEQLLSGTKQSKASSGRCLRADKGGARKRSGGAQSSRPDIRLSRTGC